VFEPSPWEDVFAAGSYADMGQVERARTLIEGAVAARSDDWQSHYNFACFEALHGDPEAAIAELRRAHELEPTRVAELATGDRDFDSIREDPRFSAIAGQADAAGKSA
jgi:Flp pilus assembly protein TadD